MSQHTKSEIEEITGQNPNQCYQCGKCSAGCPIRGYMDVSPNQVVRLVQLGMLEEALKTKTIWLCAGCLTCSSRCPKEFELAKFMDGMREIALRHGVKPSEKNLVKFHKSFLRQIKYTGRAYELGLIADYKMTSFDMMSDVDLAPGMILKGKLGFLPHTVKDRKAVINIFDKSEDKK
ncbi:MAG TPA: 4Fe-4S dicluster domain-containing protein [Ignavibacteria bacterium]|nr:4Fe-4S dicluster domain-containing protein [Ignavibacteria bacterium]